MVTSGLLNKQFRKRNTCHIRKYYSQLAIQDRTHDKIRTQDFKIKKEKRKKKKEKIKMDKRKWKMDKGKWKMEKRKRKKRREIV
jgi:hypothetical protein